MTDSLNRFSDRADVYARYRPGYPPDCISFLIKQFSLNDKSVVADIGSGTGILSALLIGTGCTVIGVEPNEDMRAVAEKQLGSDRFISINGTGEETHLKNKTVDLITVAQAFHWINAAKAKKEFKRILRRENGIAILWNVQNTNTSFSKAYEAIKLEFGNDYVAIRKSHEPDLSDFFNPYNYKVAKFPHHIILDKEGLDGLLQSSSFMPRPSDEHYRAMTDEVNTLFAKYNENGLVRIDYETHVHYGAPGVPLQANI